MTTQQDLSFDTSRLSGCFQPTPDSATAKSCLAPACCRAATVDQAAQVLGATGDKGHLAQDAVFGHAGNLSLGSVRSHTLGGMY